MLHFVVEKLCSMRLQSLYDVEPRRADGRRLGVLREVHWCVCAVVSTPAREVRNELIMALGSGRECPFGSSSCARADRDVRAHAGRWQQTPGRRISGTQVSRHSSSRSGNYIYPSPGVGIERGRTAAAALLKSTGST